MRAGCAGRGGEQGVGQPHGAVQVRTGCRASERLGRGRGGQGCWLRSPRPSPGSRRPRPIAEMARRCRPHPPGHSPACPLDPRGARTPPASCLRPSPPGAYPLPPRGSGQRAPGAWWRSGPGSWPLSPGARLPLGETVAFRIGVPFRWSSLECLCLLGEPTGAKREELGAYWLQGEERRLGGRRAEPRF